MKATIAPLSENHFEQLRAVLDSVAREGRYLALLAAPPAEEAYAFYRGILERGNPHFVALSEGRVVGWCDVLPARGQARAHLGILGIGLLGEARGCGNGAALLQATIERAWETGLSRIELTVRVDNPRAIALYERFGFQTEGLHRRAFCINGEFFDSYSMGLLRE